MIQRDGQRTKQQQETTKKKHGNGKTPACALFQHFTREKPGGVGTTYRMPEQRTSDTNNKPATKRERENAGREGALMCGKVSNLRCVRNAAAPQAQGDKTGRAQAVNKKTKLTCAVRAGGTAIPADVHGLKQAVGRAREHETWASAATGAVKKEAY